MVDTSPCVYCLWTAQMEDSRVTHVCAESQVLRCELVGVWSSFGWVLMVEEEPIGVT